MRSFRLGGAKEPSPTLEKGKDGKEDVEWSVEESKFTAGWDTKKISKWVEGKNCDVVEWVRPSIERIL